MSEDIELLCIRKVGGQWGTVTLPDALKKYPRVVFERVLTSGRIYARGIKNGSSEDG